MSPLKKKNLVIEFDPPLEDKEKAKELEKAIWAACWDLFITVEEAERAVNHYCKILYEPTRDDSSPP